MLTKIDRRQALEKLLQRSQNLGLFGNSPEGKPWAEHLSEEFKASLDMSAADRAENDKNLGKLINRAHRGDIEAQAELHALQIEHTQNYIMPGMEWGRFFEIRNLADSDSPAIQNDTKQEIRVYYVSQDTERRPEISKVIRPQYEQTVDLKILSTDDVEYRTRDIYTGDVSAAARAMFDTGFDLLQQIEKTLDVITGLLSTAIGTFDITNANKSRRVYLPHSRIQSGVLPTTNSLQLASISTSTKFGFGVFDEIVDYCVRFKGTDPSGDLMPTGEVIVPAQDIREIATNVTVTASKQNDVAEQLLRRGWLDVGSYLGVDWKLIPSNTIPRKTCFPRLNKPVGILWFKPGLDTVEENVDRKRFLASRSEAKVIGAAIPTPNLKNFLQVAYRT